MINLNAQDLLIVRRFLYGAEGQNSVPDLLSADRIRPQENPEDRRVQISAISYMNSSTGAGRFAIPAMFDVINAFFLPYSNLSSWPNGAQGGITNNAIIDQLSRQLAPGRYNRSQLTNYFNIATNQFVIQQYSYADSYDDIAARTFIYGSSKFDILESEFDDVFIISPDGQRFIERLTIGPSQRPGSPLDDFDFESSDLPTQVGGEYLQNTIDPSEIGQTVFLDYVNRSGIPPKTNYGFTDYMNDVNRAAGWSVSPLAQSEFPGFVNAIQLAADINAIVDQLWNGGTSRFLNSEGKPIVYGRRGSSSLSVIDIVNQTGSYLKDFKENGIVGIEDGGDDSIVGSIYDDELHGNGGDDTLTGGAGEDMLAGGAGDDRLFGGAGEDSIEGGSGDDLIDGGSERDVVSAGSGDDRIAGGDGHDLLAGDGGDDVIAGGDGNDELQGGEGEDRLTGDQGNDRIFGGGSDDRIVGGENSDQLFGDQGNDILVGGQSIDSFNGGANDDIIDAKQDDSSGDAMRGGTGADTFIVNNGDVVLDLSKTDKGIILGGNFLRGGERKKSDPKGQYFGARGEKYVLRGSTLSVTLGSETITVKFFANGAGGIHLRDKLPDPRPAKRQASPIVVDLDGDGLELTTLQAGVFFDIDADGFAEATSWVGADDGLLVLDNGDGVIGGAEDLLSSEPNERDGRPVWQYGSAFDLLTDDNADGIISSADSVFASLQIWRDLNQDGIADEGELSSLTALGLTSISLDFTRVDRLRPDGNSIFDLSRATTADGRSLQVADVFFATDQFQSLERDPEPVSADVAALPSLVGSGNVSDLDVAMTRDPLLAQMVSELAALSAGQLHEYMSRVTEIVLRWTQADQVAVGSRGVNINGQWLRAVEALDGATFHQRGSRNPYPNGGSLAARTFNDYLGAAAATIFAQTAIAQTILPGLRIEGGAYLTVADGTTLASLLSSASASAPAELGAAIGYWQLVINTLESVFDDSGVDLEALRAQIGAALPPALAIFTVDQIKTAIWPTERFSTAIGNSGFVSGTDDGSGGEFNNNLFVIRDGVSEIIDGTGADRYVIAGQNVSTVINDYYFNQAGGTRSADLLKFADSLASDLTFSTERGTRRNGDLGGTTKGYDVVITDASRNIVVRLRSALTESNYSLDTGIDIFEFADGSRMSLQQLFAAQPIGNGNDFIYAAGNGAIADGLAGNDTLVGSPTDDVFRLYAGGGSDRILRLEDFGQTDTDTLLIDALPGSVTFVRSTDYLARDLEVRLVSGASMLIAKQTWQSSPVISRFVFSDNTVLTAADVNGLSLGATAGDDVLTGTRQSDVIDGLAGNDRLQGREGNDDYVFGAGSGHDVIEDAGDNRLILSAIARADVVIDRVGQDRRDLRLTLAGGNDSVTIRGAFARDAVAPPIASFVFADTILSFNQIAASIAAPGSLIEGTSLNDTLLGTDGDDLFEGREGDDLLTDSLGNDSYRFGRGSGQDTIVDTGAGNDSIVLTNDIALRDLRVERGIGNDVRLGFGGADRLTLAEQLGGAAASANERIETIRRDDGAFALAFITGATTITGTAGSDLIVSRALRNSNTTIAPGSGTDVIVGDDGNNIIALAAAFGTKYVSDSDGFDAISFAAGVSAASLDFTRDDCDLIITAADGQIVWRGYFEASTTGRGGSYEDDGIIRYAPGIGNRLLEELRFADGTRMTSDQIDQLFFEPSPGDQLILRRETLDGGAGNDLLEGDGGSNTYLFAPGYGHDVIRDYVGQGFAYTNDEVGPQSTGPSDDESLEADTLEFGGGVGLDDVILSRTGDDGEDLEIRLIATGETVTIDRDHVRDHDGAKTGGVEYLVFDGISYATDSLLENLVGATYGNDRLRAMSSTLVLDALAGDDTITAGASGATVLFTGYDGRDSLNFEFGTGPRAGVFAISVADQWNAGFPTLYFGITLSPVVNGDEIDLLLKGFFGDSLLVRGGISARLEDGSIGSTLRSIQFYNSTLTASEAIGQALAARGGGSGNDTIIGTANADAIDATGGDDLIFTVSGAGVDAVAFGRGDGHDIVDATALGTGEGRLRVLLEQGIAASDVTFSATRDGLIALSLDTGADSLTFDPRLGDLNAGTGNVDGETEIVFADGSILRASTIVDQLIAATAGDDILVGDDRSQTLNGGTGNDVLIGQGGNDIYEFGRGYGVDTIAIAAGPRRDDGIDTVRFSQGIALTDLDFRFGGGDGGDLVVAIKNSTDRLVIEAFFANGSRAATASVPVSRFVFADESILTWQQVADLTRGIDTSGDDTIVGDASGDLLAGGAGSDLLFGGPGNDLYQFDRGDESDTIHDRGGDGDGIRFGENIFPGNIAFSRSGDTPDDLLIEVDGVERLTLTVRNQFGAGTNRIEYFEFQSGEVLTWRDVELTILATGVTEDDDTVSGFRSADAIDALDGDDYVTGGGGDDVLEGGFGRDYAVFRGDRAEYEILREGDAWVVRDLVAGRDGVDRLTGFEIAYFERDGFSYSLDEDPAWTLDIGSMSGVEDQRFTITTADLLATVIGGAGRTFRVNVLEVGADGSVRRVAEGEWQFQPSRDLEGTASIIYEIEDEYGHVQQQYFQFELAPANDAPEGLNADQYGLEDYAVSGTIEAYDAEDGAPVAFALTAGPANGTVTLDPDTGAYIYRGNPDFHGSDIFSVVVTDSQGGTAQVSVSVTLDAVNDAPRVAIPIAAQSATVGTAFDFLVPAGTFVDVEGDSFTLEARLKGGEPLPAWLTFDGTRFFGTPPAGSDGRIIIELDAFDGQDAGRTRFALTIEAANDAPVANDDTLAAIDEDQPAFTIAASTLLANDVNASAIGTVDQAEGGTVELLANNDVRFTPNLDFNGLASFRYTVAGAGGATETALVSFDVRPVNDAPVDIEPAALSVAENSPSGSAIASLTAIDPDLGDTHSFEIVAGEIRLDDAVRLDPSVPVSVAFTGTDAGQNNSGLRLTSMGRFAGSDGQGAYTVWRIRNTNAASQTVRLNASGGGFDKTLTVAPGTDTFVLSTNVAGSATHRLYRGTTLIDTKASAASAFAYSQLVPSINPWVEIVGNELKVKAGAQLDFERLGAASVTIKATDAAGASVTKTRQIVLTDVAEINTITGTGGNDVLTGGGGTDAIYGLAGNDRLTGGAKNDQLDGGAGTIDVAVFAGLQASYSIATNAGTVTLTDNQPTTDGNDGTDTLSGVERAEFKGGVQISLGVPIILDLNGDGVVMVDPDRSKARFDWDGDGIRDKTGWVGKGDGILVYDRNGDGRVSGANEISFVDDKPGAKSDLDGLSAFDSNGDGWFSEKDDRWSSFMVWRDKDGDGKQDRKELISIVKANVAGIALTGEAVNRTWGWNENITVNTGSFARRDGTSGRLADVALSYQASAPSAQSGRSAEAVAANPDEAADASAAMPDAGSLLVGAEPAAAPGSADVAMLDGALAMDRQLLHMVQSMAAFGVSGAMAESRWGREPFAQRYEYFV